MKGCGLPIISIVGTSKSGKTTFIEKLIPVLKEKGVKIAVVKHHHGDFEFDRPGKDTYRHKEAGASTVILSAPRKLALVRDVELEPTLREIVDRYVEDVDLVIAEGFKKEENVKIEVFQYGSAMTPLAASDKGIKALITDREVAVKIPRFSMTDFQGVADFIFALLKDMPRPPSGKS